MDPGGDLEEQKKLVLPFMQRAQEIQGADPKVAYYCRLYAVDQALKFQQRAKEINGIVMAALSTLEKDKERLELDRENDKVHCEAFALRIFGNADRVDRMGKADMNTSKKYYAASFFFEILNQFQGLDADIASKQKYAAWRASEIRKALREGRPPLPPRDEAAEAAEAERELATLDQLGSMPAVPTEALSELSIAGASLAPASIPSAASHKTTPSFAPSGVQRFWQGSSVAFCAGQGSPVETGTVGCTLPANRYMVALQDRLVEADNLQLAPAVQPGANVQFLPQGGAAPVPAEVVLVNDGMGWPPSFLVRFQDGTEQAADAQQLALPPPAHLQQQHVSSSVRQAMAPSCSSDLDSLQALPPPQGPPLPIPPQPQSTPSPPFPTLPVAPPGPFTGPAPQPPSYQAPAKPPAPPPPFHAPPPRAAFPPPAAPATSPPTNATSGISSHAKPTGAKGLPIQVITDAQKKAKYAVSALNFEDVASAVQYLNEALQLLTTPRQ